LAPLQPISSAPDGELCSEVEPHTGFEPRPRQNLREKMAMLGEPQPKRHSVDPISPLPPDAAEFRTPEFSDDPTGEPSSPPPPILALARRGVKKPG
jgi:hypothetical protein